MPYPRNIGKTRVILREHSITLVFPISIFDFRLIFGIIFFELILA